MTFATAISQVLTTIRQPISEMAQATNAKLVDRVRGRIRNGSDYLRFPFTLASSGFD